MQTNLRECPCCGEQIPAEAQKCRYCGEWIKPKSVSQLPKQKKPTAPQPKKEEKNDDNVLSTMTGCSENGCGCGFWVIVILLAIAFFSKPDPIKHEQALSELAVELTQEYAAEKASELKYEFSPLATLILENAANEPRLKSAFRQYNRIDVDESWFWSTCTIYNSIHPDGEVVSFGMFGFVIPMMEWEDFKLNAN